MDAITQKSFDAIVIGSGPGGATVARELSRHGISALILERGSGNPIKGNIAQSIRMAMIPGRSLLFTPQVLGLVRGITVGGSSIMAYATALDPPYEMFERYGIDLRSEVEQAKKDLPIAPLKDELIGPAAKRISASALDLGYAWEKLPKIVYQDLCRPNCDKCTMGCPYGAKWTARLFIDEACANGAELVAGAKVTRLVIENRRVTQVEFLMKEREYRVSAPLIILAAGGIGTPQILRSCGLNRAGQDFFFDPLIIALGVVDNLDGGQEFPMAAGYHNSEEGYLLTDLVWPEWVYWIFTAQVLRLDRLPAHRKTLPIMVKARDNLGGRLNRSGMVNKRLGEDDRMKLIRGYTEAKKILIHAGARHIYHTWYIATHPGGTAKINDLVDANLRTELDNLYVCDCSVIPEAWGLPPMLTLVALGTRLGAHLAG